MTTLQPAFCSILQITGAGAFGRHPSLTQAALAARAASCFGGEDPEVMMVQDGTLPYY